MADGSPRLSVIRTANEPLSARQIARRIMAADGIAPSDLTRLKPLECSLYASLGALEGDGVVLVTDRPKRWAVERQLSLPASVN